MMHINHIASGSAGNAIVVSDGHSSLLLDAGLPYRKLSRAVKLSEISGVLITHEHLDHCKAVPELWRRGHSIYMSHGTSKGMKECPDILVYSQINHLVQIEIASWKVLPFNVIHDAEEPMGFLFQSNETGAKGVYIADSGYVDYDSTGVTHYIIEANYDDLIIEQNESLHPALRRRIKNTHFSIEGLKTFFRTSDLSQTKEIHLVHLSDANSDEAKFIREIQGLTGVPVYTRSYSDSRVTTGHT